ncbi:MAG: endonuclease/exonuclease/phosphatase family protein [Actinomycetota bacterium]
MTRLLRVATYNIRHGRGMDGRVRLRRTARMLVRTGADVIALQEVDRNVKRSGTTDQPALLERWTGLTVHFWPTLRLDGGDFGLALAARGEMSTDFQILDNGGVGRLHGVIIGRVQGITVLATHLSRKAVARQAEEEQIARLATGSQMPVVVAGDLNQGPKSLRRFHAAGLRSDPRRRATFPSTAPVLKIDHVLIGPGLSIERTWTVRGMASDHIPLVADVRLGPRF